MAKGTLLRGRLTDLGDGFQVRRLLPDAARRAVGPFVFFDHFGPVHQRAGTWSDVRPHPHIGLATVSYLFEGALLHRDSLGTVQRIEPGAVNWMCAGRGIVHSERTPDDLRRQDRILHGLQLWMALPQALEECDPAFRHVPADQLPSHLVEDAVVQVLIGRAWGLASPLEAPGGALYLAGTVPPGGRLELPLLAAEQALYTVDAELVVGQDSVPAHTMVVLEAGSVVANPGERRATFVLIGGDPLDAPRLMWWNFVSSRAARIRAAAADWETGRFPAIPGDDQEAIPLPAKPLPGAD